VEGARRRVHGSRAASAALYGTVGWYLLGKNVWLCCGLLSSSAARAEYGENGSFGLTNDYLRAAEEVLSWRLESVALLMARPLRAGPAGRDRGLEDLASVVRGPRRTALRDPASDVTLLDEPAVELLADQAVLDGRGVDVVGVDDQVGSARSRPS
jgi:hypothetical protein